MYIYKTTNLINQKVYVGMSTKKYNSTYLGSGVLIKKAIKKYGKHNFKKELLESCSTLDDLIKKEKFWVDFYAKSLGDKCYNLADGGLGGNWTLWMDKKRYNEIIESWKKNPNMWKKGISPPNKGKKRSEETKQKISKAITGKKQSEETILKRIKKLKGQKRTEDQKINISSSIKNAYKFGFSEEHKKNLSKSLKGRILPETTKEKLRGKKTELVCPICSKIGAGPIMYRYHFSNCKKQQKNEDKKDKTGKNAK